MIKTQHNLCISTSADKLICLHNLIILVYHVYGYMKIKGNGKNLSFLNAKMLFIDAFFPKHWHKFMLIKSYTFIHKQ